MIEINIEEVKNLLSPYLMEGYKKDTIVLSKLYYSEKKLKARLNVESFFMPADGQYHFTAFHTQLMVCQLMMLHLYINKGVKNKPGEAYMKSFSMELMNKIQKSRDIEIILYPTTIKKTSRGFYAEYNFRVEKNAFTGSCSGLQIVHNQED